MGPAVRQFETVYRRHEGLVRATLRHYGVRPADLDDVAQEAFVTIHRKFPEFEGRSSLETWLHAVCWRTAVGYRRRAHIQRETPLTVERQGEPEQRDRQTLPAERLHERARRASRAAARAAGAVGGGRAFDLRGRRGRGVHAGDGQRTAEAGAARIAARVRSAAGQRPTLVDDASAPDAGCTTTEGAIETADSFDYIDDEGCICVLGAKTFVVWRRGSRRAAATASSRRRCARAWSAKAAS